MKNEKKILQKKDYEIEELMDSFCDYILHFSNISVESLSQLESIFKFILKFFDCTRSYIYEIENNSLIKIFELCSEGHTKNSHTNKKETLSLINPYIDVMKMGESIVVDHIESLAETNPELYTIHKTQGISRFIYSPLLFDSKLIGYIGMDNPKINRLQLGAEFLARIANHLSFCILSQIKNRKEIQKLHCENKNREGLKRLSKVSSNNKADEFSVFHDVEESYTLKKNNSAFRNYIKNNFFDAEVLIRSIANPNSLNYIYFGDLQTNIFYVSDNMVKKFGLEGNVIENFLDVWEGIIYSQKEQELYRNDIKEIIEKKKKIHNLRYRVKDARGEKIWIHCQGEVLWDRENTKQLFFSGYVSCQEDEYLIDPITNFPREAFAIRSLSSLVEEYAMIRIIGFSLNNFNEINELRGKRKGDHLLSDIARQLSEEYNGRINFYRLDGLRFAAILHSNFETCEKKLISEIRDIILKHYFSHNITVQSPCSFCYMTAHPGEMEVQDMISNTVLLINIAKSSMEDSVISYSAESIKEKKHYAEMVLEITKNIQNDFENFRLVIQPTFTAGDHKIKGGEALLRWKFKGSNVPPSEFIPILEKTKLINIVGRWVLKNVVKITRKLLKIRENIKLSFNVSYTQIYDEAFFDYLSSVLEENDVDASNLILELTETNFNENPQKLADFFNTCIGYGLNLALDDFGSGYSSIGLLLKYPTSIVKLDKSLLYEISNSEVNQKFIKSIINSCHLFGKEVCAEGVESRLELEMMKEVECDIIQGFYFSKPLELPDFFHLIAESESKAGDRPVIIE